jgi:hypothetical protein
MATLPQEYADLSASHRHTSCSFMSDKASDFDWSPFGESWWLENQKTVGASDLQVRFAASRYRGMNAAAAARAAGYMGDALATRQAGSRAAQSTSVQHLMALARAEARGDDNGHVGLDEARSILSRLARGADPLTKIRAIESLAKIDRDERELKRAAEQPMRDPLEELRELALISPSLAAQIAKDRGLPWDDKPRAHGAVTLEADNDAA